MQLQVPVFIPDTLNPRPKPQKGPQHQNPKPRGLWGLASWQAPSSSGEPIRRTDGLRVQGSGSTSRVYALTTRTCQERPRFGGLRCWELKVYRQHHGSCSRNMATGGVSPRSLSCFFTSSLMSNTSHPGIDMYNWGKKV